VETDLVEFAGCSEGKTGSPTHALPSATPWQAGAPLNEDVAFLMQSPENKSVNFENFFIAWLWLKLCDFERKIVVS